MEIKSTLEIVKIQHNQTNRLDNSTDKEFEDFRVKSWLSLKDLQIYIKKRIHKLKYNYMSNNDKMLEEIVKEKILELEILYNSLQLMDHRG